jgi:hypothetical protein
MSEPGPPTTAEVENLVVIFLGFTFATFLYGLTFFRECLSSLTHLVSSLQRCTYIILATREIIHGQKSWYCFPSLFVE